MNLPIDQKREEYQTLFGKRPFYGWNVEKLQEKIDAFDKPETEKMPIIPVTKVEKIEEKVEEKKPEPAQIDPEEKLVPVFKGGRPFAIMGGEYVPWGEAEAMVVRARIERDQAKLDSLTK